MTDETPRDNVVGEQSRRSVLKKGAVAAGGLALGTAATGSAAAQQDDNDDFINDEQIDGAMFIGDFDPDREFIITSPVIDYTPNVNENIEGVFDQFNTRMIQYQNSKRQAQFFVSADAQLPSYNPQVGYVVDDDQNFGPNQRPQPEIYTLRNNAQFFDNSNQALLNVTASPLEENNEDDVLDTGGSGSDWWW